MKKSINRISIVWFVLAIAVILIGVAFCLYVMTVGVPDKKPIPNYIGGDVTTTAPPETAPPATSTEPEITTAPEVSTEPATTTAPPETTPPETTPEETTPVTTTADPVDEKKHEGVVYLTFDDGPSKLTSECLDILKEYGVNATFFVIGFTDSDSWKFDIMQRALDEGNVIALHGHSHEYADIYKSLEAATGNFYTENQQIKDALGIDTKIIRFPGGSSNTVSRNYCKNVMTDAAKELTDNGYNYFDWNVSSGDAGSAVKSSEDIYQNVINGVSRSRVNVVLMHDGNGHQATIDALPRILEWLIDNGYEFGVITDDTPNVRHKINN